MKKERCLHLAILLSAIALISGCTTTTNMVQPASTGTIIGQVYLYEVDGKPSASSAGVDVATLGTNRHATSDSAGQYTLNGLPAGYYQMRFSKSGFSSYVSQYAQPFIGADTDWSGPAADLTRINNWKVVLSQTNLVDTLFYRASSDTVFYLQPHSGNFATIEDSNGTIDASIGQPTLVFFAGRTPNIDYHDSSTYFSWTSNTIYNSQAFMTITRSSAESNTIYLIAYPTTFETPYFQYYSGNTLITELTGFGPPSNVVKIVLP